MNLLAFASDVYLVILDAKNLLEIFEGLDEVLRNFLLVVGGNVSDREPSTNWLFNPGNDIRDLPIGW